MHENNIKKQIVILKFSLYKWIDVRQFWSQYFQPITFKNVWNESTTAGRRPPTYNLGLSITNLDEQWVISFHNWWWPEWTPLRLKHYSSRNRKYGSWFFVRTGFDSCKGLNELWQSTWLNNSAPTYQKNIRFSRRHTVCTKAEQIQHNARIKINI